MPWTRTHPGTPQNVPIPDPSELTTDALNAAVAALRDVMETRLDAITKDVEMFRLGHEEKHNSVVDAAIRHRKELSDASVATVKAQIDAQFVAQQSQISNLVANVDTRFGSIDLRYQQRFDAQTEAVHAASEAQKSATTNALASAKEAVQTALAASQKAIDRAETATDKLIPRAEVESRLSAIAAQISVLTLLSDRVEKIGEGLAGLDRVTDAKFITFRTLIDSQADKVALALAASNAARDAAFSSSDRAITKAETFNEKRFDLISAQIDELKAARDVAGGRGAGATALWGYLIGAVGVAAAIAGIVSQLAR
jgi:hypothetical protein